LSHLIWCPHWLFYFYDILLFYDLPHSFCWWWFICSHWRWFWWVPIYSGYIPTTWEAPVPLPGFHSIPIPIHSFPPHTTLFTYIVVAKLHICWIHLFWLHLRWFIYTLFTTDADSLPITLHSFTTTHSHSDSLHFGVVLLHLELHLRYLIIHLFITIPLPFYSIPLLLHSITIHSIVDYMHLLFDSDGGYWWFPIDDPFRASGRYLITVGHIIRSLSFFTIWPHSRFWPDPLPIWFHSVDLLILLRLPDAVPTVAIHSFRYIVMTDHTTPFLMKMIDRTILTQWWPWLILTGRYWPITGDSVTIDYSVDSIDGIPIPYDTLMTWLKAVMMIVIVLHRSQISTLRLLPIHSATLHDCSRFYILRFYILHCSFDITLQFDRFIVDDTLLLVIPVIPSLLFIDCWPFDLFIHCSITFRWWYSLLLHSVHSFDIVVVLTIVVDWFPFICCCWSRWPLFRFLTVYVVGAILPVDYYTHHCRFRYRLQLPQFVRCLRSLPLPCRFWVGHIQAIWWSRWYDSFGITFIHSGQCRFPFPIPLMLDTFIRFIPITITTVDWSADCYRCWFVRFHSFPFVPLHYIPFWKEIHLVLLFLIPHLIRSDYRFRFVVGGDLLYTRLHLHSIQYSLLYSDGSTFPYHSIIPRFPHSYHFWPIPHSHWWFFVDWPMLICSILITTFGPDLRYDYMFVTDHRFTFTTDYDYRLPLPITVHDSLRCTFIYSQADHWLIPIPIWYDTVIPIVILFTFQPTLLEEEIYLFPLLPIYYHTYDCSGPFVVIHSVLIFDAFRPCRVHWLIFIVIHSHSVGIDWLTSDRYVVIRFRWYILFDYIRFTFPDYDYRWHTTTFWFLPYIPWLFDLLMIVDPRLHCWGATDYSRGDATITVFPLMIILFISIVDYWYSYIDTLIIRWFSIDYSSVRSISPLLQTTGPRACSTVPTFTTFVCYTLLHLRLTTITTDSQVRYGDYTLRLHSLIDSIHSLLFIYSDCVIVVRLMILLIITICWFWYIVVDCCCYSFPRCCYGVADAIPISIHSYLLRLIVDRFTFLPFVDADYIYHSVIPSHIYVRFLPVPFPLRSVARDTFWFTFTFLHSRTLPGPPLRFTLPLQYDYLHVRSPRCHCYDLIPDDCSRFLIRLHSTFPVPDCSHRFVRSIHLPRWCVIRFTVIRLFLRYDCWMTPLILPAVLRSMRRLRLRFTGYVLIHSFHYLIHSDTIVDVDFIVVRYPFHLIHSGVDYHCTSFPFYSISYSQYSFRFLMHLQDTFIHAYFVITGGAFYFVPATTHYVPATLSSCRWVLRFMEKILYSLLFCHTIPPPGTFHWEPCYMHMGAFYTVCTTLHWKFHSGTFVPTDYMMEAHSHYSDCCYSHIHSHYHSDSGAMPIQVGTPPIAHSPLGAYHSIPAGAHTTRSTQRSFTTFHISDLHSDSSFPSVFYYTPLHSFYCHHSFWLPFIPSFCDGSFVLPPPLIYLWGRLPHHAHHTTTYTFLHVHLPLPGRVTTTLHTLRFPSCHHYCRFPHTDLRFFTILPPLPSTFHSFPFPVPCILTIVRCSQLFYTIDFVISVIFVYTVTDCYVISFVAVFIRWFGGCYHSVYGAVTTRSTPLFSLHHHAPDTALPPPPTIPFCCSRLPHRISPLPLHTTPTISPFTDSTPYVTLDSIRCYWIYGLRLPAWFWTVTTPHYLPGCSATFTRFYQDYSSAVHCLGYACTATWLRWLPALLHYCLDFHTWIPFCLHCTATAAPAALLHCHYHGFPRLSGHLLLTFLHYTLPMNWLIVHSIHSYHCCWYIDTFWFGISTVIHSILPIRPIHTCLLNSDRFYRYVPLRWYIRCRYLRCLVTTGGDCSGNFIVYRCSHSPVVLRLPLHFTTFTFTSTYIPMFILHSRFVLDFILRFDSIHLGATTTTFDLDSFVLSLHVGWFHTWVHVTPPPHYHRLFIPPPILHSVTVVTLHNWFYLLPTLGSAVLRSTDSLPATLFHRLLPLPFYRSIHAFYCHAAVLPWCWVTPPRFALHRSAFPGAAFRCYYRSRSWISRSFSFAFHSRLRCTAFCTPPFHLHATVYFAGLVTFLPMPRFHYTPFAAAIHFCRCTPHTDSAFRSRHGAYVLLFILFVHRFYYRPTHYHRLPLLHIHSCVYIDDSTCMPLFPIPTFLRFIHSIRFTTGDSTTTFYILGTDFTYTTTWFLPDTIPFHHVCYICSTFAFVLHSIPHTRCHHYIYITPFCLPGWFPIDLLISILGTLPSICTFYYVRFTGSFYTTFTDFCDSFHLPAHCLPGCHTCVSRHAYLHYHVLHIRFTTLEFSLRCRSFCTTDFYVHWVRSIYYHVTALFVCILPHHTPFTPLILHYTTTTPFCIFAHRWCILPSTLFDLPLHYHLHWTWCIHRIHSDYLHIRFILFGVPPPTCILRYTCRYRFTTILHLFSTMGTICWFWFRYRFLGTFDSLHILVTEG